MMNMVTRCVECKSDWVEEVKNMSDNKGISKAGVGLLGMLVGVAAGVASVVLSDKKNRETALKKAKELHKQAEGTVDEIQKKAQTLLDKADDVKDELLKEADEKSKTVKKEAKKS